MFQKPWKELYLVCKLPLVQVNRVVKQVFLYVVLVQLALQKNH